MQTTTEWKSPGTSGQNTSAGNGGWDNRDNIKIEDGVFCSTDVHSVQHARDVAARIRMDDGSIGSSDYKNPDLWNDTLQYIQYDGGLWGKILTPAIVNSSNFGFAFRIGGGILTTYWLLAYNFGFAIPDNATIVSVSVKVKRKDVLGAAPGGSTMGYVDHIAMQVTYSLPDPPPEYKTLPRKDFCTGYNCFVSQYVNNKAVGKTPWRTPTTLY